MKSGVDNLVTNLTISAISISVRFLGTLVGKLTNGAGPIRAKVNALKAVEDQYTRLIVWESNHLAVDSEQNWNRYF